jgi:hypothetical protein
MRLPRLPVAPATTILVSMSCSDSVVERADREIAPEEATSETNGL